MSGLIDAHIHLWPREPKVGDYVEPDGLPFPTELDGSAEAMLANMDRFGVDRAIVVQSPWWAHDDAYILEAARQYPGRFTPVGCFPLRLVQADPEHEARRLPGSGLEGVRVHAMSSGDLDRLAGDEIDSVYGTASDLGVPVLFFSRRHGALPHYHATAGRFPDLIMVVEHMAYVTPPFEGDETAVQSLLSLAERPNIVVKLAIHHQHSQEGWPWRDTFELQHRLIRAFGAERLMWGSNWPMKLPDPSYEQRLTTMSEAFPFQTSMDREAILGGTARRLWPDQPRNPLR